MLEQVLFARQPIFNRDQQVFAYELLFRNGAADKAEFIDGDLATRSVLLNAYTENSSPQVLNGKPGFLNVGSAMMSAIPSFAQQFLVVEILESEHNKPEIVAKIQDLRARGFKTALDDFDMKDYRPELIDSADIIKLDVLAYTKETLALAVQRLRQHPVQLLAEKVETQAMYQYTQSLGFDLYQGYFFCRPELVKGHILDANRRSIFDLLRELYQPEVDVPALSAIVKRDVVLSYKLLKLVNSSFYRRLQTVDSINHAVMILGVARIRSWATLVCLGKLGRKPDELQTESLMRGHMCEYLGEKFDAQTAAMSFSVGLLSCMDAWLDQPLGELMALLPLSPEFHEAVVHKQGQAGMLLSIVTLYMHSQWHKLPEAALQDFGLELLDLSNAYEYAIAQTDEISILMIEE